MPYDRTRNRGALSERRIRIAPSLLSADFGFLVDQIRQVEQAGAEVLHWDVMDGHFVPNLSIGAPVIERLRAHTDLYFDTHLMITDPLKYAEPFVKAGSDLVTFHIEAADSPQAVIDRIRSLGAAVGVSLNPATPAAALNSILTDVDLVLVMSVWPGFGGQSFISDVLGKVSQLAQPLRDDQRLEIDGGIDRMTAPQAVRAGADTLVAGSAIFGRPDCGAAFAELRAAAEAALRVGC